MYNLSTLIYKYIFIHYEDITKFHYFLGVFFLMKVNVWGKKERINVTNIFTDIEDIKG